MMPPQQTAQPWANGSDLMAFCDIEAFFHRIDPALGVCLFGKLYVLSRLDFKGKPKGTPKLFCGSLKKTYPGW